MVVYEGTALAAVLSACVPLSSEATWAADGSNPDPGWHHHHVLDMLVLHTTERSRSRSPEQQRTQRIDLLHTCCLGKFFK